VVNGDVVLIAVKAAHIIAEDVFCSLAPLLHPARILLAVWKRAYG